MTEEHFKLIDITDPNISQIYFRVIEGEGYYIQNLQDACNVLNEQKELIDKLQEKIQQLEHPPTLQDLPNPKLVEILKKRLLEPSEVEQTIQNAYENERTAIGKSVLKQLLESLQ